MKSLSQVSIRYLKEQKKRTLLTILGIIISVAMITSIGTMMHSMEQYELRNTIERNGYNHGAFVDISGDQYQYIENNINLEKVSRAVFASTGVNEDEHGNQILFELVGFDQAYLEMRNMLPTEGRLPQQQNEIALERWKVRALGIEIGEEVTMPIGNFTENGAVLERGQLYGEDAIFHEKAVHSFTLVGIVESNGYSQAYRHSRAIVDLKWAESVNDTGTINAIFRVKDGLNVTLSIDEIAQNLNIEDSKVQYNYNLIRRESGDISPELIAIAVFLIGLVCVATVAVIYNSFHISVLERIKHFGVMRSIGTTPRQIRSLVFTEATILSIISAPIGLAAGFFATKLLFYLLTIREFSSFENLEIITSPIVLGGSALIGTVAVFLSAFSPAISAGRISPLDAIFKHRALKREGKTRKGFLLGKIFGSEGLLAYKNIQRNKKRMVITAFSISISVIMFIVFSVFSSYAFRISENLHSYGADFELYTWGQDLFSEDELNEIIATNGLKEIVPLRESHVVPLVDQSILLNPIREIYPEIWEKGELYGSFLQGYNNEQIDLIRPDLIEGSANLEEINRENGVIVILYSQYYDHKEQRNEILKAIDLNVGDIINVNVNPSADTEGVVRGELTAFKVVGILEKAPIGTHYPHLGSVGLITSKDVYERNTEKVGYNTIYANLELDENYNEILSTLESITNRKNNARVFDRIASNRRDRQMVFELSVLIYGFITLISLIGVLNIINTISTNLLTRTKEFGMLRAVGMSPKSMRKMIRLEAIFRSITGAIFGLVVGNLLGYYLYTLISRYEGYPWIFPLNANIIALFATVAIALLAAVAPLRKIASLNIIETLREE